MMKQYEYYLDYSTGLVEPPDLTTDIAVAWRTQTGERGL